MESIKALLSLVSCLIFLGVTSLAGAVTIAPPGVNFSAAGIISITSPDFNVPLPAMSISMALWRQMVRRL